MVDPQTDETLFTLEAPPDEAPLRTGDVLEGRYRVIRPLASGGMGVVYLVDHVVLGRAFAVKVLLPSMSRTPSASARFLREARAASRLHHDNIVSVADMGATPDGLPYLVMEYLEGPSLDEVLRGGPLAPARAARIAGQLASALDAAHRAGIIHRDLKPANVILVERGGEHDVVKLLDFGIAKLRDTEGTAQLTRGDALLGTPAYMAPEQVRGGDIDERTDVYALGCILYEMLTGAPPFQASNLVGTLTAHLLAPVVPPSQRAPAGRLDARIDAVVVKALAKTGAERQASMRELSAAIDEAFAAPAPHPTPRRPMTERWSGPAASLVDARLALGRGDRDGALQAAERAVAAAGGLATIAGGGHAGGLEAVYAALCPPPDRRLTVVGMPTRLDPRAAFVLSRLDGEGLAFDDLVAVSGMPRLEVLRIIARLVKDGLVIAE